MGNISITTEKNSDKTSVSNCFIDHYMTNANNAQIKIYLYMLRAAGTNLRVGISDLADRFNLTENDVIKALSYWEKSGALCVLYDQNNQLAGVQIKDLDKSYEQMPEQNYSFTADEDTETSDETPQETQQSDEDEYYIDEKGDKDIEADEQPDCEDIERSEVSAEQLRAWAKVLDNSVLIYAAEQYLNRSLGYNDLRSLYYMAEDLKLSHDLIDHLMQYCVGKGHSKFNYMEAIARGWKSEGIKTQQEAVASAKKYNSNNKSAYEIMKRLGRGSNPAPIEMTYVDRWINEMGMPMDVILKACDKAVMNVEKHRFEYADKVLNGWSENGLRTLKDIDLQEEYHKPYNTENKTVKKEGKSQGNPGTQSKAKPEYQKKNSFNDFQQKSDIDWNALVQKIKVN